MMAKLSRNNLIAVIFCALVLLLRIGSAVVAADKKSATKEPSVRSYITLYPGSGATCGASKKNADAKNNHDKRRIQATFRDGGFSVIKDFGPGQSQTVGFCNYGKLRLVSAKYMD